MSAVFRSMLLFAQGAVPSEPAPPNAVDSHNILVFAAGVLTVVLLAGVIVGVTSILWAWSRAKTGRQALASKQLHFAAATMTGLGLLFSMAMAMNIWGGERGKEVFDACKISIPPIVTFVLGYYFTRDRQPAAGTPKTEASGAQSSQVPPTQG